MNRLAEICAGKQREVADRKRRRSLSDLDAAIAEQGAPRGFAGRLADVARTGPAIIAEIKRASPSKGLIRADFDPVGIALAYQAAGAACLSVLTDRDWFQGGDEFLVAARAATALPALRKDFMVDPWQIAESRVLGADAVLLIMAAIDDALAAGVAAAATEYGMDVLVEVHDEAELDRAVGLGATLIGVNNRDLATFETDLAISERLSERAPPGCLLVSESGIADHADIARLSRRGITAFLVGESLMRQRDVGAALRRLIADDGAPGAA